MWSFCQVRPTTGIGPVQFLCDKHEFSLQGCAVAKSGPERSWEDLRGSVFASVAFIWILSTVSLHFIHMQLKFASLRRLNKRNPNVLLLGWSFHLSRRLNPVSPFLLGPTKDVSAIWIFVSFGTATLPSEQGGMRKGVLPSVTPFYSEHN